MPNTAHVHPRLGIGPFKKFEPFFIEALRAFPKTTEFRIDGGLSPNTIIARMRDSMLGYRLNRWTDADPEFKTLFDLHDGKWVLRGPDQEMRIWFTERQAPGSKAFQGTLYSQAAGTLGKYIKTQVVVDKLSTPAPKMVQIYGVQTEDQIATLAALKAQGSISDPIVFQGDIRSEHTMKLQSSHDIIFYYDQERNETILM